MEIIKSDNYLIGICSITELVGSEKKLEFDEGKPIEVTKEQFEAINNLGWCELTEVKDGK